MNRKIIERAARWWVVVAVAVIAGGALVQAFLEGEVTFQAAFIALCVAVVTLVQAIGMRSAMLSIGAVGGMASTYLWIAQGVEVSPANPLLFGLLLALLVVGLFGTIGVFLILSTGGWSRRQVP